MPGLVIELQRDALDRTIPSSDLLRKALLVSRKLGVKDIEEWIKDEMNGYIGKETPVYRKLTGILQMRNPYHGWQTVHLPQELEDLTRANLNNSLAQIESLQRDSNTNYVSMKFTGPQAMLIMKFVGHDMEPQLKIAKSLLDSIIDAVRTRILEFSLDLEQRGILGNDMTFTDKEKTTAHTINYINNHIGQMNGSQIQQASDGAQQIFKQIDNSELSKIVSLLEINIEKLGLHGNTVNELRADIETLKAQFSLEKPKMNVVKICLQSVKSILEGATGNILASTYLPSVISALHKMA